MAYEKPELSILNLASTAVRSNTGDNVGGDGTSSDTKLHTTHEQAVYDSNSTSSTASAYEADE